MKKTKCPECDGTGEIENETSIDICHNCEGKGYILEERKKKKIVTRGVCGKLFG